MKVLFFGPLRVGLRKGGLEFQIQKTFEALRQAGVEVHLYNQWETQIDDYDICHFFSIEGSLLMPMMAVSEMGKPIVISPVLSLFSAPLWLNKLRCRLLARIPGMYSDIRRAKAMFQTSNLIICLNNAEKEVITKAFMAEESRCIVVPNGVDDNLSKSTSELFENRFGFTDFVLHVGRFDSNKNQRALIEAMLGSNNRLVLIGGPGPGSKGYMDDCVKLASEDNNIVFLGEVKNDDPLLASAYAAAKVFVLPSYSEVMPLSLLEAAAAKCKIVISKTIPSPENIHVDARVPPDNSKIIRLEIEKLMAESQQLAGSQSTYIKSWADIGSEVKANYDRLFAGN